MAPTAVHTSRARRGFARRLLGLSTAIAALMLLAPASALAAPPANDSFANALVLPGSPLPVTDSASNVEATRETGEPEHAHIEGGGSLWWRWTAPKTATITIDTCGSDFDTLLGIYTGTSVDALTEVASSDDAANDRCVVASGTTFRAQAGTTYSIAVDGFGGETGAVTLRLSPPPANDDFADAAALPSTGGQISATTLFAGSEPGEPLHAGFQGVHSVWWRWLPPANGTATLQTCGSSFDTVLAVYTGTAVEQLAEVVSNDNTCEAQSRVTFTARGGTNYWVVVDGPAAGFMGPIVLDSTFDQEQFPTPPPPTPTPVGNVATAGNDLLRGTGGPDLICGLGGSDTITGLGGNDTLYGDACPGQAPASRRAASSALAGNDRLIGGAGNDRLYGSGGRDTLEGGRGRDRLVGGKGRDALKGGAGNDTLVAKDGARDVVDCGKGRDTVRADRRDRLRGCE
jgi:Ca2+-binding RTX toxin-like protein